MGSQSTLPPVKSEELVRAINRLGIPCYLGGMSRGLLGAKSDLQVSIISILCVCVFETISFYYGMIQCTGEATQTRSS
jgi:hypothetical protein